MLRLLPIQILLAALGAVNGIVSSLFASNAIGSSALGAVGLDGPISMLLSAVSILLVGGASILCSTYLGRNERGKMQGVFSLDLLVAAMVAAVFIAVLVLLGALDLTAGFTKDPAVRAHFNRYLLGQSIGVFPMLLGSQLASFLSLENQTRRVNAAGVTFIAANAALTYLFVSRLQMGSFGLALAGSLAEWVFFAVEAGYFLSRRAVLRFSLRACDWSELGKVCKIGLPGAAGNGYQTLRGYIVNALLVQFVGSAGLSAFAACNSFLGLFWAVPNGMLAVSRMLIGVSVGEEDRQSLTDIMRVMLRRYVPMVLLMALVLSALADPLTRLYCRDSAASVYAMTRWGFRILPFCMPLSVPAMHVVCCGQTLDRHKLVHLLSLLDGVVCVSAFSALLIPAIGTTGLYVANVLNGVTTIAVILADAWRRGGAFPRSMEALLVLPRDFGALPDERMDLSVRSLEEVCTISGQVQEFCRECGVDGRRALLSALFLEEMAGNVVAHGFGKDRRRHSVDVRVVCRRQKVILRVRDDCVPFDPEERARIAAETDPTANLGIRMVFRMAEKVEYQSILGLNVLTIHI
ncbi:MAG: hypothetical protein E7427_09825 [Ruminococcaceae bacterium]|nr:hypothetical protein [Oscillospiraceae bacterium]